MGRSRAAAALLCLVALVASAEPACEDEASCVTSDETPLLQVAPARAEPPAAKPAAAAMQEGAQEGAKKAQPHYPPMPHNGPGIPPSGSFKQGDIGVNVKVTTVVIPGNIIIGQNVTAGSGNTQSVSNIEGDLKELLAAAAESASHTAASTAGQAVQEVKSPDLPRFVTDTHKIWYVDADGKKHVLVQPPRGACSMCGCFYDEDGKPNADGNYDIVSAADIAAIPDGADDFSCIKYWPPPEAFLQFKNQTERAEPEAKASQ